MLLLKTAAVLLYICWFFVIAGSALTVNADGQYPQGVVLIACAIYLLGPAVVYAGIASVFSRLVRKPTP
jgi:hypothetical protein